MGWITGFEPATPRATIWYSNQLSYTHHNIKALNSGKKNCIMARLKGLEPLTHCLEGSCSIHLSYRRTFYKKNGADDGNRTHVTSLEGWNSTIELHPHLACKLYNENPPLSSTFFIFFQKNFSAKINKPTGGHGDPPLRCGEFPSNCNNPLRGGVPPPPGKPRYATQVQEEQSPSLFHQNIINYRCKFCTGYESTRSESTVTVAQYNTEITCKGNTVIILWEYVRFI